MPSHEPYSHIQPSLGVPDSRCWNEYAVGPPLILNRKDASVLFKSWADVMDPVYQHEKGVIGDMYAYSMSAAHLQLPHSRLNSFMVSAPDASSSEAWQWVDKMSWDPCVDELEELDLVEHVPSFIHMCRAFLCALFACPTCGVHESHDPSVCPYYVMPCVVRPRICLRFTCCVPRKRTNCVTH